MIAVKIQTVQSGERLGMLFFAPLSPIKAFNEKMMIIVNGHRFRAHGGNACLGGYEMVNMFYFSEVQTRQLRNLNNFRFISFGRVSRQPRNEAVSLSVNNRFGSCAANRAD